MQTKKRKGVRKNPQENLRLYMHKINQPVTSTDGKEIKDSNHLHI